ncbi:amino acid ABC transporter membrane protein, PAAT family [Tistlia consotensis]|uniref:Glutamate/aspartate import permease protein GltK n=1 Tax=Tistlia consotensis USBA 355 TaxID=560819 RepID=A0A1Y6CQ53_9PROT|nr:amino acid ABC transporter permease [Tistlia consotensis]SMF68768.1 amino acid ABC transporter membrane protein, PAAT family [Tistlia consotensis USBA 355]SNS01345.1 amino acid ABC transporter membrane protein, PAAT family [Tistlia consotensis]
MLDLLFDGWERPEVRRPFLFVLFFVLLFWLDLHEGALGDGLLDALGLGHAGLEPLARALPAALVSGFLILDFWLISFLPLLWQIAVVWAELLGGFVLFVYAFNLDIPYIVVRLPIMIGTGAVTTIYVSAASIFFASIIALFGALARLSKSGPAFAIATFYISFFRGTPLLLQIFLIYLGLPQFGINLEAVPAGILALSLCYGAYMAEIFRAGIQGVPHGQSEASTALGLSRSLTLRKVVLPQAMKLIVPPTGNQFIAMLKDSSLVSVMGVLELMYLARTQGRAGFRYFEMLITAAVIYWIISFCFEMIQARIERHYGKADRR